MSISGFCVFILLFFCLPGANISNAQDLRYTVLSAENGLSSSEVYSVVQDNDGYIWGFFATMEKLWTCTPQKMDCRAMSSINCAMGRTEEYGWSLPITRLPMLKMVEFIKFLPINS